MKSFAKNTTLHLTECKQNKKKRKKIEKSYFKRFKPLNANFSIACS